MIGGFISDTASANAAYLKQMVRLEPTTAMPDSQSFASNTSVSPAAPTPNPIQTATVTAAPLPVTEGVWQTSTDDVLPVGEEPALLLQTTADLEELGLRVDHVEHVTTTIAVLLVVVVACGKKGLPEECDQYLARYDCYMTKSGMSAADRQTTLGGMRDTWTTTSNTSQTPSLT